MQQNSWNSQRGVGLIEVLIAVLILAIGLLGLAGLQTTSLKYSQEAFYRTQATIVANDILDRIRANRKAALTTTAYQIGLSDSTPSYTNCETNACDPNAIAKFDLAKWRAAIAENLPNGKGSVEIIDSAGVREYVVLVQYVGREEDEQDVDGDGDTGEFINSEFEYRVRL